MRNDLWLVMIFAREGIAGGLLLENMEHCFEVLIDRSCSPKCGVC
jgi:hypothetical protein